MAASAQAVDRMAELERIVAKNRQKWIQAIGKHSGKFELAEDLVQSGILQAIRYLSSFRGEASLSSWIFSIIINQARSEFRRPEYRFHEIEIDETISISDGTVDAERARLFQQMMVFVNRLPAHEREAVCDFYLRDRWGGHSEPTWQKTRKWRGIKRIRQCLNRQPVPALIDAQQSHP